MAEELPRVDYHKKDGYAVTCHRDTTNARIIRERVKEPCVSGNWVSWIHVYAFINVSGIKEVKVIAVPDKLVNLVVKQIESVLTGKSSTSGLKGRLK